MTTCPSRARRPIGSRRTKLTLVGLIAVLAIAAAACSPAQPDVHTESVAAVSSTMPDLVVTSVVKPAVAPGTPVRFSATVKNQGGAATPSGTIIGVQFIVDGKTPVTWSDTDKTSLAGGASVTLTANGGQVAATWTATAGTHTVKAWVDDVNRIRESSDSDNTLTTTFTVSAAAPPPPPSTNTSPTTAPPTTVPPTTAPRVIPLPPPPPSGGFQMGIATGSPYGWVNQSDVNTLVDLGAKWMRSDISQGVSLTQSDGYITMARRAGINVLGILMPTSTNPSSSASWAGSVVARYAPLGVHVWEWRNEPNWMATNVPVATYTAELKAAYTAIHAADPAAVVLTGGLVPALGTSNSPEVYLQGIYNNGGKGFFDGVADHPYAGNTGNVVVSTWPEIDNMTAMHNVLAANGDGAKRVWATEVGFSTTSGCTSCFSEANAATMLVNLVNRLKALAAQGVAQPVLLYYSERDRTGMGPREDSFGLVRTDLSHKPAYATFKSLAAAG
jgi:hypothetical protein